MLRKLNSDYQTMLRNEVQSSTFLAATGEDPESVKPVYDYEKTQEKLKELAGKIIRVKHAINIFD